MAVLFCWCASVVVGSTDRSVPLLTASASLVVIASAVLRILRKYRWSALCLVPLPLFATVLAFEPNGSSFIICTICLLCISLFAAVLPPAHVLFWLGWAGEAFMCAVLVFFTSFWRLW